MQELAIYAMKTGACLAVYYLFFKLLLSRETFHRFNRLLLLATLALSFALPWCVITIRREVPVAAAAGWLEALAQSFSEPVAAAAAAPAGAPFAWGRLLGALYLAGVVVMLLATLVSAGRVLLLVRQGRREPLAGGWTLVQIPQPVIPFSWWRYVVVSEADAGVEGFREIVVHETAHLRLHHSWDLLLTDLAGCLQWFNPAMWLLRSELRAIHEYEADAAVLDTGIDARQYQLMLIRKAVGKRGYSVANSFNHSKLKNRITMMLQKRSSRWASAKALVMLPLACVALGAFARTVEVPVVDRSMQQVADPETRVTVQATVFTMTGQPISGVIVREQGAESGAVTDESGLATLTVDAGATLEVSYVGYSSIQVTVQKDGASMQGAGKLSAMASNRDDETVMELRITMLPEWNPAPAPTSAAPASVEGLSLENAMVIHARTVDRADASRQPLYLVDGKQVGTLDGIDPKTIDSIDVLKNGELTQSYVAQYGDQARNGVVLVRLKSDSEARTESQPAAGTSIRIVQTRTVDRADASRQPLCLVDGKVVASLNSIDTNQIQSIDVLKGEHAQSYVEQYGEQARNGVIIVHLKSEAEQQKLSEQLSYFDSEAWKEAKARFQEQQERFAKQQDLFQEQQARFKELQEQYLAQSEYFRSDEWKDAQNQLRAQAAYFKSDEWKAVQERLQSIGSQK